MGAIKIFDDTKAEYMIPGHYGTFSNIEKQIEVLKKMYHTNDEYKSSVKILNIGEQFTIKK
jgi:L-ascorbate metabolism protein UlaG (beta-lactamase superfamily)